MAKKRKQIKKNLVCFFSSIFLVLLNSAGQLQKKPDVPYVPTPEKVVQEMLKMADVGKEDVLYDLGCGDGRIVITAVKELGCQGVGIDINPARIKDSQENAVKAEVTDRVNFLLMDLFEADISQATVVTLYLLSEINLRLRPRLFRDLKPGTRVVSHDFSMGKWKSDKSVVIEEEIDHYIPIYEAPLIDDFWDKHNVYFWIIPANVAGLWKWTMPGESDSKKIYTLELDQTFQEVQGKASDGYTSLNLLINNGKIEGDRLEFVLERQSGGHTEQFLFEGSVEGDTMEGFYEIKEKPGIKHKWKAKRDPSTRKPIDR